MVRGKLRCLGTPLELKRRFGSGYKLSIGIKKDRPFVDRRPIEKMLIDLMRKGLDVKTGLFLYYCIRYADLTPTSILPV